MPERRQSKRNTLEQGRAEFAYQCAQRANANDHIKEEYKSLVKKLPMLIKTNGLGASMAFFYSKAKDGKEYHERLASLLDCKDKTKLFDFFKEKARTEKGVYQTIWECANKKQVNKQNAYDIVVDCVKQNIVAHYEVYRDISDWLTTDEKDLGLPQKGNELMEEIINLSSPEYRTITIEVLAFLSWLKRFADGLIQESKNKGNTDGNGKG